MKQKIVFFVSHIQNHKHKLGMQAIILIFFSSPEVNLKGNVGEYICVWIDAEETDLVRVQEWKTVI